MSTTTIFPEASIAETIPADSLIRAYDSVRKLTVRLCAPLEAEDMVIQTMPEMSPTRWHIAHTTWFFETFILKQFVRGYRPAEPAFEYLFNSYYNAVGKQFPRDQRGHLSRPTVGDVFRYRRRVDESMHRLLRSADEDTLENLRPLLTIGVNHEQQHQELMVTDIKHAFSRNPLFPTYCATSESDSCEPSSSGWHRFDGGLVWVGHPAGGFCYDNEEPRHQVFLRPFDLDSRAVTCGDYLAFMADGGYANPMLWLSEGWAAVQRERLDAPLYWQQAEDGWSHYTLGGFRRVDPTEPVCHVSYYEADAFARWAGARLPLESEWEIAAETVAVEGNFVESGAFHPRANLHDGHELRQMFGDVWEWTASSYSAYPGYQPAPGAIGEYNGKFMCNQYVLRGGSCATPQNHIRATYRNFFPAGTRWQFSGIRLARDAA